MEDDLRYHVYIEGEYLPNSYTYAELMEAGLLDPEILKDDQVYIKSVNETEWKNAKDFSFIYINESGEIVRHQPASAYKPDTRSNTKSPAKNTGGDSEAWGVIKFLLCLAATVVAIILFFAGDIGKPFAMGIIFGSWYWAYHK